MNRIVTIKRHWLVTLLAAVCIPLGTQTAWAQEAPVTYQVTRTARTNNVFTFTQPSNNVEVTVTYEDAVVSLTTTGDNPEVYYYMTLAEAIADASSTDVETITLLADETISTSLAIDKSVILDLNGKTLTYTGTGTQNENALTISSGKTVIIIDTSTGETPGCITATGEWDNAISNSGTLTVNGGSITSPSGRAIWNQYGTVTVNVGTISGRSGIINYGTLTVTGGSISATGDNCNAISIYTGTFNLSGNPTLSGTDADIYLETGITITIPAALTAPATAWTVYSDNIFDAPTTPYIFTTGFSTYCKVGEDVADPAAYFDCITANITTRLASNEAQFVTYVALDAEVAATVPVIINNGQTDVGTRAASLAEGNVWVGDQLSVSTTATPGITWQWYRKNGTTETAIEGATAATYTLTADDVGCTIIAKATQPMNIAGIGYPAADVTVASTATVAVVKKDNFGTLADITAPTMDYIGVEITPVAGVEYLVVANGVAPTAAQWELATTPTADEVTAASLTITQFAAVSGETASLSQIMPDTPYDLYYRLVETDDTKAGTTDETYGKSVNEKNTDIQTLEFNRQVTIEGVTYLIEDDTDDNTTAATAKIIGLPAVDDAEHAGHKTAHAYASIAKTQFTAHDLEVYNAIGYTIADETEVTDVDWDMNISSVGNAVDSYGYLVIDCEDLYDGLKENGSNAKASPGGYQIFNYNDGEAYFVLGKTVDNKVVYEMAKQNKGLTNNLTAALDAVYEGGVVKFYNPDDTELPTGTSGANNGKPVAASGQTVKVVVTLPTGFEFIDSKNVITVANVAGDITLAAGTGVHAGKYVGTFTMPNNTTSAVNFKELVETTKAPIQGREIDFSYTIHASVGITPDGGNVYRIAKPTVWTIAPRKVGNFYYKLTDLGLSAGVTSTIVDAADETQTVSLPTEKTVKVTLVVPPTYEANAAVELTPTTAVCAEDITFRAGNSTYFDATNGLALHEENANLTFKTVSSVSGTTVTLAEITSKQIPAETPVIVNNAGADATVRMDYGTYDAISVASQFKGTAVAKETTDTDTNGPWNFAAGTKYYGFNGSDFVWIKTAGDVAAHRCWIEINSTANAPARFTIDWGDGPVTDISGIDNDTDSAEDGDWYDLNGRKLQGKPTQKGVYIKNGKKVVVK